MAMNNSQRKMGLGTGPGGECSNSQGSRERKWESNTSPQVNGGRNLLILLKKRGKEKSTHKSGPKFERGSKIRSLGGSQLKNESIVSEKREKEFSGSKNCYPEE